MWDGVLAQMITQGASVPLSWAASLLVVGAGAVSAAAVGFFKAGRAEEEVRRLEDQIHALDKRLTTTETQVPAAQQRLEDLRNEFRTEIRAVVAELRADIQNSREDLLAAIHNLK